MDSSNSGKDPMVGSCEKSNKPLAFIKGSQLLDWLANYQLF
jgi:hypothetical protein